MEAAAMVTVEGRVMAAAMAAANATAMEATTTTAVAAARGQPAIAALREFTSSIRRRGR